MSAWQARAADAPLRAGVFVDFDGTLAPIVADPVTASPHPAVAGLLAGLSRKWGRVVVISGRPVEFLLSHLAGAGRTQLYGLYGLYSAAACLAAMYPNVIDGPTLAPAPGYTPPKIEAVVTPQAYNPLIGSPFAFLTRALESMRTPP